MHIFIGTFICVLVAIHNKVFPEVSNKTTTKTLMAYTGNGGWGLERKIDLKY